jgi:hypothetical protein
VPRAGQCRRLRATGEGREYATVRGCTPTIPSL